MSGYIGNKPSSKVTGIFTPNQQYDLVRSYNWGESDPFWDDVVLLLQPFTGATSIEDLSKSNHFITNNGVTLDSTNEKWTGAPSMKFEESNSDYLSLPDSNDWYYDTSDFTIEAFFNRSSGTRAEFFSQYVNNSNYQVFRIRLGELQYTANGDNTIVESPVSVTNNNWYHAALTRQGNTFRVFLDGALLKSATDTISVNNFGAGADIGFDNRAGSYFDGNMTSFRITKGVARYTSNFTPPTRPFPTR